LTLQSGRRGRFAGVLMVRLRCPADPTTTLSLMT
jgi:hypothetical protein